MRWIPRTTSAMLAVLTVLATTSSAQQTAKSAAPPTSTGARPVQGKQAQAVPVAKAATPRPVDPEAPAKMDAILKKWEANSVKVTKLDVIFTRIDEERGWGKTTFEGRAVLQSPNLAWLDLQKVEVNEKTKAKEVKPHERIISTGKEIWQYSPPIKQIIIHPLAVEERQRALDQGPLPFLFNMKAAEARKRYAMTLLDETPEVSIIKIVPLLANDLESFEYAIAQLDKVTLQPRQLRLVDKARDTKDYWITKMDSNPTTDFSKYFVGERYAGWSVERNEGNKNQTPAVGQRPQAKPREAIGMPKARRQ